MALKTENMTQEVITFNLTAHDLELMDEISLAGVISSKIAKGDYIKNLDITQLQTSYESCHKVNEVLHKKLNRIRRALNYDETESPESELDNDE